jgi:protein SCO1/2
MRMAIAGLVAVLILWGATASRPPAGAAPARAEEGASAGAGHEHAGHDEHTQHGEQADHAGGHEHHEHKEVPGSAPLPDRSVYQLEGAWTDQNGRPFRLGDLRGHPVVALMFYGTCTQACPILVHDAQRLDEMLDPAARERTRYLLVTFDPARDTPERLTAYARERKLDPARWTLLHGSPDQVRALAMVLGVKYRPAAGGEFNHTMRITLLDREGVAALHVDGLRQPLDSLAKSLSRL